jgi:alpha-L-rhamnosidase
MLKASDLRVENLVNPIGIDEPMPHFSWKVQDADKDQSQTAYRILVALSAQSLETEAADVWDSQVIESDECVDIRFGKDPLVSTTQAFWKVQVWDKNGQAGDWSDTASFSIGLLDAKDWRGSWIGVDRACGTDEPDIEHRKISARYLRHEFELNKPIQRATAYIVGVGVHELHLNGSKVGNQILSPGLTQYEKRVMYVAHDVTALLQAGPNAVGVVLGAGRFFAPRIIARHKTITYGYPKLLFQLELQFADGEKRLITSDDSWKLTTDGPIVENNEYDGEYYDARKEMPGWSQTEFDDSAWQGAEIVAAASPKCTAQKHEPIRVTGTVDPVAITSPKPGIYIIDMGQNMAGWTRLLVSGKRGTIVKQRFAERLNDDGTLYVDNLGTAKVTDTYVLKGERSETFEPRFVYHGFRYAELTGYPGTPTLDTLQGQVINDDLRDMGGFSSSNPLLNQIYQNAVWGIRANYKSIPLDCPQRDERQGWLGDRLQESRGESYIFGVRNFYRKWLGDIFDAQLENGSISDVCPSYWPKYSDNVTWPSAHIFIVETLFRQYGDDEVIRKSYPHMKKWVGMMIDTYMVDKLMPRNTYGDWGVPPAEAHIIHSKDPLRVTDGEYIGSGFFYEILRIMVKFAELLENPDDAQFFDKLAQDMRIAFNAKYFDEDAVQYSNNTATTNVIALAFDLVPKQYESAIFANLVKKIEIDFESHVPCGLIGMQYFNRVLTRYGRADLAYRVNTRSDYPSYGFMIDHDATTIWELWNGNTANPSMNSGNHIMLLGDLIVWFYEELAGIKPDTDHPGFKKLIMKPSVVGNLTQISAWHETNYGMVKSDWSLKDDVFEWSITIPPNTTASVHVPNSAGAALTKNGEPVRSSLENGHSILSLGSGIHTLKVGAPI